MKASRKNGMHVIGIISITVALSLAACGNQGASVSGGSSSSLGGIVSTQVEKQAVSKSSAATSSSTADSSYADQVSIEGDYSYEDKYNSYHVLIVKNNSDSTLKIASNSTAFDEEGNLIGADDADARAIGPNCTSYLREIYTKVSGISKYETKLSASEDKMTSVLQDLELSVTPAGSNVVLQCTNSGNRDAQFVRALVMFFDGDTLVGTEEKYLSNNSEPIAPGETHSEQVTTLVNFDSVSACLSGRG